MVQNITLDEIIRVTEMTKKTEFVSDNRIVKCCDKESMRYAIQNVLCVPDAGGKVWLVATDGRQLTAKQVDGTTDETTLVPPQAFPKTGKTPATISLDGCWGWRRGDTKTETGEMPDGRYPNFADIVDIDVSDCLQLNITSELLHKLASAITAPKSKRDSGNGIVTLFVKQPSKGRIVEDAIAVKGPQGIGVLMPCTGSAESAKQYKDAASKLAAAYRGNPKQPSIREATEDLVEELDLPEEDCGRCRDCGGEQGMVEPDAENYRCEECNAFAVDGRDIWLMRLAAEVE